MNKLSKITVLGTAWVMGLSVIGAKAAQAAEDNNRGSDNAPSAVWFETISQWVVITETGLTSVWESGDTSVISLPHNSRD